MMQQVLSNWSFFRVIRLALGVFIIAQGLVNKDLFSITMGVVFSGLAIFNVGCCGAGGCATDLPKNISQAEIETVDYTEVTDKN